MRKLQKFHSTGLRSIFLIALAAFLLSGCGDSGNDDFIDSDFDYVSRPPTPNTIPLSTGYDRYTGVEDTVLQVSELYGVLANDTYPIYNTTITWPRYTTNGGYLEGYSSGAFEYEPKSGFTGQDSFTYTLTAQDGRTTTGQVYIQVYPVGYRINGL